MQAAGYTGKVKIGMDVAASEFLTKEGQYDLNFKEKDNDGSQVLTPYGPQTPTCFEAGMSQPALGMAIQCDLAIGVSLSIQPGK